MKKVISFMIAAMVLVVQAGGAGAVQLSRTCNLTTNFPTSTSLVITAMSFLWEDDPNSENPNAFLPGTMTDITPGSPTAPVVMNFGSLTNTSGGWGTTQGFALYVANSGNTGAPWVQFAYSDTNNPNSNNPNGNTKGLGWKVAVGFTKLVYDTPTHNIETPMYTRVLKNVNGLTITPTALAGGFLRVTMGVYRVPADEDPAYTVEEAEGFTSGDLPGDYSGTLTVTALHA